MFIMLDGIDGSGKSTIIETWKTYLQKEGNPLFDLRTYWGENGRHPEVRELQSYDFIFSAEPTTVGVGQVVRNELIAVKNDYSLEAQAQGYSLDRLVLYTKLLIPALTDGRCVIQDRGVSTSLCYQAVSGLPLSELQRLPGNDLALKHPPDHLIILDIDPSVAMERLHKRTDKQDAAIFERLDFLKKAAAFFKSSDFRQLFEQRGTTIHYLPAEQSAAIMQVEAVRLLKKIIAG